MSEHHVSLGGTITLDYATMAAVVGCVAGSAIRQGFRRLFVLNGHGGNIAPLEAIVAELTVRHRLPIACATYWQVAEPEIAGILERQRARAPRLRGRDLDDLGRRAGARSTPRSSRNATARSCRGSPRSRA